MRVRNAKYKVLTHRPSAFAGSHSREPNSSSRRKGRRGRREPSFLCVLSSYALCCCVSALNQKKGLVKRRQGGWFLCGGDRLAKANEMRCPRAARTRRQREVLCNGKQVQNLITHLSFCAYTLSMHNYTGVIQTTIHIFILFIKRIREFKIRDKKQKNRRNWKLFHVVAFSCFFFLWVGWLLLLLVLFTWTQIFVILLL